MISDEQIASFIQHLQTTGLEAASARAAGATLHTINKTRSEDAGFDAQVQEAIEFFNDSLEREAIRRARDGIEKPVYYKGEQVDVVREYSDTLLAKLLTGRRPKVYGDKKELTGANGGSIIVKFAEFADNEDIL